MCGRYASSRRPEDLLEEFEVVDNRVQEALAPDWNVAPTKPVYAVVERAPAKDSPEPPRRQLRVLTWGLVPSWAKDPSIGSRLINARMETVAEKPAFRRALAARRCLLPADGYYEWYPTQERTKAGKVRKQPFFIHPKDGGALAMAGLYEIWRDPDEDDAAEGRFRWTCTVITTDAADDLGRIHDRMPLMVEPDRWHQWLDPRSDQSTVLDLLVPAAPGRLEAVPVSTAVNAVRNNGPELVEPLPAESLPLESLPVESLPVESLPVESGSEDHVADVRMIPTPHGDARLVSHRARRPAVTLLLSHGAGGGIGARDLEELAVRLPRHGASVVLLEQPWRVAGRRIATPAPTLDDALVAAANQLRVRTPLVVGGRSAGARSAARCARRLASAGCLALSFPLHPPGRPERSRLEELEQVRVPTLVVQGELDPMGRPEEFPGDLRRVDLAVVPGADHGLKVPRSAELSQEDALGVVVEAVLGWLVRRVTGNALRD